MPFNSDTYFANKYRREAWDHLAAARDIKARASRGEAYSWEPPRIKTFVTMARNSMRLHPSFKRMAAISKARRSRARNGS